MKVNPSQELYPSIGAGAQLGIFECRGPTHKKGHIPQKRAHQNFLEEDTACEYCFPDS